MRSRSAAVDADSSSDSATPRPAGSSGCRASRPAARRWRRVGLRPAARYHSSEVEPAVRGAVRRRVAAAVERRTRSTRTSPRSPGPRTCAAGILRLDAPTRSRRCAATSRRRSSGGGCTSRCVEFHSVRLVVERVEAHAARCRRRRTARDVRASSRRDEVGPIAREVSAGSLPVIGVPSVCIPLPASALAPGRAAEPCTRSSLGAVLRDREAPALDAVLRRPADQRHGHERVARPRRASRRRTGRPSSRSAAPGVGSSDGVLSKYQSLAVLRRVLSRSSASWRCRPSADRVRRRAAAARCRRS